MWQFIISGYVPGTSIQLSFDTIAQFGAIIILVYLGYMLYREEQALRTQQKNTIQGKTI